MKLLVLHNPRADHSATGSSLFIGLHRPTQLSILECNIEPILMYGCAPWRKKDLNDRDVVSKKNVTSITQKNISQMKKC